MDLETLIAYLSKRITLKGKKVIQKLIYFCAEAGVPISARFRMYLYGPYSNEVANAVGEAIAKEILVTGSDGVSFLCGGSCDEYLTKYNEDIDLNKAKIDRVLNAFSDFTPMKLELYATVHFIASALREVHSNVGEAKVVEEVRQAKGKKFAKNDIEGAYRDLVDKGWLREGKDIEGNKSVNV